MPLDARKTQHILNVVPKTFAGRQRTVVFVALASGVYSYTAVQVIIDRKSVV